MLQKNVVYTRQGSSRRCSKLSYTKNVKHTIFCLLSDPADKTPNMGRYTGKTCRLLSMLSLTFSFFLVEIIVGYITNSLALVGDSYHMLSDVVALLVGFASVRVSKWICLHHVSGRDVLHNKILAEFNVDFCVTCLNFQSNSLIV